MSSKLISVFFLVLVTSFQDGETRQFWRRQQKGDARDTVIDPNADFKCPDGKSIAPHPERCDWYYTCYFGDPVVLWQCSDDLVFDLVYDGCNFLYLTDCGDRLPPSSTQKTTTTTRATTTTTKPSSGFQCPSPNGVFPINPDVCSPSYYQCVGGTVYTQTCPGSSVFDPVKLVCVSPGSCSV